MTYKDEWMDQMKGGKEGKGRYQLRKLRCQEEEKRRIPMTAGYIDKTSLEMARDGVVAYVSSRRCPRIFFTCSLENWRPSRESVELTDIKRNDLFNSCSKIPVHSIWRQSTTIRVATD